MESVAQRTTSTTRPAPTNGCRDMMAEIGAGFYIGHYGGITISGAAKIGRNVNISQLVTIGESTIGDNVYIAPGAKIFGKIMWAAM